uniref:Uncharacterized protein n=1 Tax=Romanomermis culicivorax TaxID=13658 RepID=A0A915HRS7_ROMCU
MYKIFALLILLPFFCNCTEMMMMNTFKGKVMCGKMPVVQALVELRGPVNGIMIGREMTNTNGEFMIESQAKSFPANIRITPRNPCKGKEFVNQNIKKLMALDETTYTFGKINLDDSI